MAVQTRTKPFSGADETILKRRAGYPDLKQGDGKNAVHFRFDLDAVMQPIPRRHGQGGGSAMIEAAAAILTLISIAIFAAHAVDAYRTG